MREQKSPITVSKQRGDLLTGYIWQRRFISSEPNCYTSYTSDSEGNNSLYLFHTIQIVFLYVSKQKFVSLDKAPNFLGVLSFKAYTPRLTLHFSFHLQTWQT